MGLEAEDKFNTFYEIIHHRLDTKLDENGHKLSMKWGLSHEVDSGLLYSGVTPSDAVMVVSEEAKRTELQGLKTVLNDLPMPIYARTSGNKIAFANRVFAGLYGTTPDALVGSCKNYVLECNQCDGSSRCPHKVHRNNKYNLEALKTGKTLVYTEFGLLTDGTEVIFKCTEKPITLSMFKNTTVCYMFPMRRDGSVLLDTDGDGVLSRADSDLHDHNVKSRRQSRVRRTSDRYSALKGSADARSRRSSSRRASVHIDPSGRARRASVQIDPNCASRAQALAVDESPGHVMMRADSELELIGELMRADSVTEQMIEEQMLIDQSVESSQTGGLASTQLSSQAMESTQAEDMEVVTADPPDPSEDDPPDPSEDH